MDEMKNREIANIFNEIADLLEIKGENPFRIKAYRRAALNIESLTKNIEDLSHKELLEIPGIGKDLDSKVEEYIRTGKMQAYEEIKQELPSGLLSILAVHGIGPKTARLLYEKLNIKDLDDLERFASEHTLAGIPGIKQKTEKNILKGIGMLKRGMERQPLGKVLPVARDIMQHLIHSGNVTAIDIAGSLRRWKETIKDIDILAASENAPEVMKAFVHLPHVKEVVMYGPAKSSIITMEGLQVDLRIVGRESYGAALAYFTGSKAHNIRLREMAAKKGLKINEYGIFREKDNNLLGGQEEEDIYRVLGLHYVQPELREDRGEIEAALAGSLPKLIAPSDVKGDLHIHSQWSDGQHTIEQLVDTAKKLGYSYIAITDHSKGLVVAGGLNEERILEQKREIEALNKKLKGFKILHGTEVDIKSDGNLDFDDDVLKGLDIVIAAIHSGFRQSRQQITHRIVSAMKNPYVDIIAHPTGRLLGERDAYDIDMDVAMKTAKETGTIFEINSHPLRLDMDDLHARRAKEMCIPVVISTDSHVNSQMDFMTYGVSIARRGWLEKSDVLNTLKTEELLNRLKNRKS